MTPREFVKIVPAVYPSGRARRAGIQARKPPIDNREWEAQAYRRSRCRRDQEAFFNKRVEYRSGLAFLIAGKVGSFTPRERASEQGFAQQRPATLRQAVSAGFFFTPDFHASLKFGGFKQRLHENHLVNATRQEKRAEIDQPRLGQVAATIEVTATRLIGGLQGCFVLIDRTGEAARNRPEARTDSELFKERVRVEPRYPAIAVRERGN